MSYGSGHKKRSIKDEPLENSTLLRGKKRKESSDNMFNSTSDEVPMFRAIIKTTDAGAIIGKGGENIKRLRAEYSVNMSIPDSKSPERVLIIKGEIDKICQIILEIIPLFEDYKNFEDLNFEAELRMLVLAGYVGAIMGSAGGKIKALREETGASIKVYEDCCPFSQERVFRINGTLTVLVEVVKRILEVVQDSSSSRPQKDPVYYDPNKTAAPDFPENEMQPPRIPPGGASLAAVPSRNAVAPAGGGRHYGSAYGSGDVGFRDGPVNHRNSRAAPSVGGGGAATGRGSNSRSMAPPPHMDMLDGGGPMVGGSNPGIEYGGGPHSFQAFAGGPHGGFRHGPDFNLEGASDDTRTMKVSIKNEDAGAVIGPKGATINRVRERSGCNIKIDDGRGPDSIRGMRIITITGTDQQIQFAQYLMQQSVKQDQNRFDRNPPRNSGPPSGGRR